MTELSTRKPNPVVRSLYILGVITAICLLAIILVISVPADLGAPYEQLEAGESYTFDPWELSLGRLHLSYPEGGVLVGAYRRGELTAIVLIADGTALFHDEGGDTLMPVTQVVLQGHPGEMSVLRGQTYIEAQVHPDAMQTAATLLQATAGEEPLLEVFGVKKVFLPRRGVMRAALFGNSGERGTYLQARRTFWSTPGKQNIIIANPEAPQYPPHDQFLFSLAVLSVMVAAVAAGVVYVTPVYEHWTSEATPQIPLWLPIALALLHSVVEAYLGWLELNHLVVLGWRVMVFAAVLWIADTQGDSFNFLGLRSKKAGRSLATGIWCGFLLFLCGSVAWPDSINVIRPLDLLSKLLYVTLSIAVFQETLWRGLVQGTFRQRYGAMVSIACTTALAAFFSLAPAVITRNINTAVLIQSFFIVPLSAFILGYVYERTHNILSPLATVATIYLLPLILHF